MLNFKILKLNYKVKFKKLLKHLKKFKKNYSFSFISSEEAELILNYNMNMDELLLDLKKFSEYFLFEKNVSKRNSQFKKMIFVKNEYLSATNKTSFILFNMSASINRYYIITRPTKKENSFKKNLINFIQKIVEETFYGQSSKVILFGSTICGLDCIGSDIDVAIQIGKQNGKYMNQQRQKKYLQMLISPLKRHSWLDIETKKIHKFKVKPILNAKVPIISVQDQLNSIELDLSLYRDQIHVGEWINQLCEIDKRVRIFLCAIKFWSKQRCINDGKNGFLNSFGFVILGIKFLQTVIPPIIPFIDIKTKKFTRNWNKMNVGNLLFLFFTFFNQFDFEINEISIRVNEIKSKRIKYWLKYLRPDQCKIIIEDPIEQSHNVARNLRQKTIEIMKKEFKRAKICLYYGNWKELTEKKSIY